MTYTVCDDCGTGQRGLWCWLCGGKATGKVTYQRTDPLPIVRPAPVEYTAPDPACGADATWVSTAKWTEGGEFAGNVYDITCAACPT